MATCTSCNSTITEGTKFCNNCGAAVDATAVAAPVATAPAGVVYTKFCASCGKGLVADAVVCPTCGAAQKGFNASGNKSKTTAVLLAVFLSAWTWVYTYRVNAKKFWIAFALWVVGTILIIVGVAQAVRRVSCDQVTGVCTLHGGSSGVAIFANLIFVGVWLWAIIDTSIKNQSFYSNL